MALTRLLAGKLTSVVSADLTVDAITWLRELGEVRLLGWGAGEGFATEEALRGAVRQADILIAGYEPITAALLDAAPRLRIIASIRGEPRVNVDVAAATARGIPVLCAPGRSNDAVAEFTIAVMLAMTRKLVPAVQWMRQRPPDFVPIDPEYRVVTWGGSPTPTHLLFGGLELSGRTLGLVGLGRIGRAVARKARGLEMRLLGSDPDLPPDTARDVGVEVVPLNELLAQADVISVHASLTPTTRGMLGAAQLGRTKRGAYLVNTARSAIVDRHALLEALQSGHLAGAALDVFDEEPPSIDDPLVGHPNVLPTPHIAAWTSDLARHHSRSLIDDIQRIRAGYLPLSIANPEVIEVRRRRTTTDQETRL